MTTDDEISKPSYFENPTKSQKRVVDDLTKNEKALPQIDRAAPRKTKLTKEKRGHLLYTMQREIEKKFGVSDFDPVIMMTMIGMDAMRDRKIKDVDPDTGKTHITTVPGDMALALNAFSRAAPYVRAQLKSIDLKIDDETVVDFDLLNAKKTLAALAGVDLSKPVPGENELAGKKIDDV